MRLPDGVTFMRPYLLLILALTLAVPAPALAASVFITRVDDPAAVYVTAQDFGVKGDGRTDDTAGIQAAIDKAATMNGGIVFVPSGRYRLTRTIFVWRAVRVIGYGATRPVFVLAIGRIDVPQRPIGLVFGGPARRTLFILTHHTLYALQTKEEAS
jgi:hypothetical protein